VAVLNPDLALYYSKYNGKDLCVQYTQSNTTIIYIYIYIYVYIFVFVCVYFIRKYFSLYFL